MALLWFAAGLAMVPLCRMLTNAWLDSRGDYLPDTRERRQMRAKAEVP